MAADDSDDPNFGAVDPGDLIAQQAAAYGKEQDSGNATTRAISNIRYGLTQAFGGGPQVSQAKAVQDRMKQIIGQVSSSGDDEDDPIANQMRLASAMATGMADVSPKIAMNANAQMVKLQQAKTQQQLLQSNIQGRDAATDEAKLKTAQGKVASNYTVFDSGTDPATGLPSMKAYGEPLSLYRPDGTVDPDFYTNLNKAMQTAKDGGAAHPIYLPTDAYENGKGAVADTKAKVQLAQEQMREQAKLQAKAIAAAGPGEDAIRQNLSNIATGTMEWRSIPKADMEAHAQWATAHGLSGIDFVQSRADAKAMNAAAGAIGQRDGKTAYLTSSIPALGDKVLDALDNVPRTRFGAINSMIAAGGNATGSPQEARYAASIQGFVNEYARVINGGTGVVSDQARQHAHDLLSTADSPDRVKAVINQLRNEELSSFTGAGQVALEMMVNPDKYKSAVRVSQALGFSAVAGVDPKVNGTPPQDSPAVQAGKAAIAAKPMPAADKLQAYAEANFGGDPAKAKAFLQSKGYK